MIMFFLLLFFWSIIDGKITVESILLGSSASILIIYLNKDILFTSSDGGPVTLRFLWHFTTLIAILIVEIVKSNINVAKIVLNPKMPIEPSFVRVPVRFKKDFNKVLYGNVVTLTPGTLTVDIVDDEYIIHALTKEAAEGLLGSELENHVLRLEEKA
ncbi:MAG TPA: Na+/H+ antiporter subunit E [Proteiniclasticum sp.]|nr:Na+/H+ antiporter subunit E [Proteiniclasticum sp.]